MKKALGRDLTFISRINADGSASYPAPSACVGIYRDFKFELHRLSITENTWLAFSSFSTFVVKFNPPLIPQDENVNTIAE